MRKAARCKGTCGRELAPWGTTPWDRLTYYPGVEVTVRAQGMCSPCWKAATGRTTPPQRMIPEQTIALIEADRLDEVLSSSTRYLAGLLRRHGREDLLPKLNAPLLEHVVDVDPCGARRGGTAEVLPCGRPPRSTVRCELARDHDGGHYGRSKAGRWFSW